MLQFVLAMVAVVLATVLAVTLFRSVMDSVNEPPPVDQYVVPAVLGYTVEEAEALESIRDVFVIEEADSTVFSDEYPEGTIARQEPAAEEIRKGSGLTIKVWVSAGVDRGVMEDVINLVVAQAEVKLDALIKKYGLTLEAPEELMQYNDEVTEGHIISSTPAAGEPLNKGDTITLVVSKGRQTVKVPPFVNLQIDGVLAQLPSMKLGEGTVTEEFDEKPAGTILAQDPIADSDVPEGTVINFTVSKGPEAGGESKNEGGSILYPGTDGLTIPLPSNKDEGYLKVFQDGRLILEQVIDCTSGSYFLLITANGETRITAYLDDEVIYNKTITVDGYYG